jgi:predicted NAD/FAD-dependent oxidoreductase
MKVGIVGAGIAGLACAARLEQAGIGAVLFDKGHGPGGRLSTLTIGDMEWDFGAPYLRAGDGSFAAQVEDWRQAGLIAAWPGGPTGALVGTPGMAALVAAQCANRDVRLGSLVQRLSRDQAGWYVRGPELSEGPFAAIAIATPSEQAAPLLSLHDLGLAREAASSRSGPCWTAMAAFPSRLAGLPDFLQNRGPIAWAARNNSKPGRAGRECWVIQADADWSRHHLESGHEDVATRLLGLLAVEARQPLPSPTFLKAHRWRFALSFGESGKVLWNSALLLGACGDWCMASHVEGAWRSGVDLGGRIASRLREVANAEREPIGLARFA